MSDMSDFFADQMKDFGTLAIPLEALRRNVISDLKTFGLHAPACRGRVKDQAYCPLCRCIKKWGDM